jgi:low temperature requirement protein LtrA
VVSLVGGAVEQTWTIRSFLVGGFSLAIIFCLWWGYFEDLDGSEIRAAAEAGRTGVYQGWLYAHLPLVIGLTAVGISIERVLLASPGSSIPTTSRWLLCGALATCLFALGAIRYTAGARVDRSFTVSWTGRIGAGGVALLLGAVGGNLSPVVLCGVLVVVCIAPILLDFHEQYVYRSHEVES